MLVIRDDPQIDLLVKIACARGQGGPVASEVRKNEFGHWEEKDVFSSTSCPAKIDLSVPDQITVYYPDDDRRLVAWRLRSRLFDSVGALFAGVEASQSGGHAFTVLALSGAQIGALPGADRGPLGLWRDDSMTWALTGNMTSNEKLQPVMVSANKIIFRDEGGDEVIFERQQYRVAIRRGRSEPITGYLWMVGENRWAGIESRWQENYGGKFWKKRPSFLWGRPFPR